MTTSHMTSAIQHVRRTVLLSDAAEMTDGHLLDRFIGQRDEVAFEVLVRRHGPMVLGVCRRVLRNQSDVEDAFQATFLVLVRKARTIVPRGMVANWLYGTAYYAALKAKALSDRRCRRERQVFAMPESKTLTQDEPWLDLQPILDRELNRLPDKYRVPVVLCYLEGKTRKEAARQLGVPEGTVAGRLARAKTILARRLGPLGAGAIPALLAQEGASASVPTSLVALTTKGAELFAAGQRIGTGVVSTKVIVLTEGVLKAMLLTKLKITAALFLLLSVVGTGAGMFMIPRDAVSQSQPARQAAKSDQPGKPEQRQKDLALLQGTWIGISVVANGKEATVEEIKGFRIWLKGDELTFSEGIDDTVPRRFRIKLNPVVVPNRINMTALNRLDPVPYGIDMTALNREYKGAVSRGIYSLVINNPGYGPLEEKFLRICISNDPRVKERPTEFRSDEGSKYSVLTLKKVKPETIERPARVSARTGERSFKLAQNGTATCVEGLVWAMLGSCSVKNSQVASKERWSANLKGEHVHIVYERPRPAAITSSEVGPGADQVWQVLEIVVPIAKQSPDFVFVRCEDGYRALSKYRSEPLELLQKLVESLRKMPASDLRRLVDGADD